MLLKDTRLALSHWESGCVCGTVASYALILFSMANDCHVWHERVKWRCLTELLLSNSRETQRVLEEAGLQS